MVETFNPTDLIADEIKPEIPEGYETSYELAEGYKEKIKDADAVINCWTVITEDSLKNCFGNL